MIHTQIHQRCGVGQRPWLQQSQQLQHQQKQTTSLFAPAREFSTVAHDACLAKSYWPSAVSRSHNNNRRVLSPSLICKKS